MELSGRRDCAAQIQIACEQRFDPREFGIRCDSCGEFCIERSGLRLEFALELFRKWFTRLIELEVQRARLRRNLLVNT